MLHQVKDTLNGLQSLCIKLTTVHSTTYDSRINLNYIIFNNVIEKLNSEITHGRVLNAEFYKLWLFPRLRRNLYETVRK